MCIPVRKDEQVIYHIYLEESFDKLPEYLQGLDVAGKKLCIVTDSSVYEHYGKEVEKILDLNLSMNAQNP